MRPRLASYVALAATILGATALVGCGKVEPEPLAISFPDAGQVLPPFGLPDASVRLDVNIHPPPRREAGVRDVVVQPFEASFFDGGFESGVLEAGIQDSGFDQFVTDSGWVVAAHYPMPTVVNFGGAVIASPVFTAVTFPGYDLLQEAQQFVSSVGSSLYWSAVAGEYGVGAATAGTPVVLTEMAPTLIDDTQVQTWLATKLDGSNPAFGTPSSDSVYVLFYPTGTSVTLQGLTSCTNGGFGGYHNSVQLTSGPWANLNVSYAVVPECTFMTTAAQELTESASHELIEAVTDPLPLTNNPTYAQTDENDIVWDVLLGGGEVADMCAQNPNAFFLPAGFMDPVQRSWSNQAALEGHDPCQPSAPGVTYFNAIPRLNAMVNLSYMGQTIPTEGLLIPLHGKRTVEVDLFSDGPMGDWTVGASDLSQLLGGGPYLSFAWDSTTGKNGTKLHLTITALAASQLGGEAFQIVSQSGNELNYWLGFVGQQ